MMLPFGQLVRFGCVGLAATAVHSSTALSLHHLADWSPLWSNAVAFTIAWFVSYLGNWAWTFSGTATHSQSAPRFLAVALSGFCLNQVLIYLTTSVLGWPFWAGLCLVLSIVPILTFTASRLWAYRTSPATPKSQTS